MNATDAPNADGSQTQTPDQAAELDSEGPTGADRAAEGQGQGHDEERRSQTHEISIDAPPAEVWKALTEAEGIVRWFTTEAEVQPGPGGEIHYVWQEMPAEGSARIEAWEPERRLVLRHLPPEGTAPEEDRPILEEWTLQDQAGGTLLRLVQSQVPGDENWDDFYDSTYRGWRMYLEHLRHGLEVTPGRERRTITLWYPVAANPQEAWDRLMGAVRPEDVGEGPKIGATLRLPDESGGHMATVLEAQPPGSLVCRLDVPNDPLIAVMFEGGASPCFLWAQVSEYPASGELSEETAQVMEWIRRLFPPMTDQDTAQPGVLRRVLSVLAGVIAGGLVVFVVETLNSRLFPFGEGVDLTDPDAMAAAMANAPTEALALVLVGYALGSFVGATIAARLVPSRPMRHGLLVGGILMAAGMANLVAFDHPLWMAIGTVLVFLPAAYLGVFLARSQSTERERL